MPPVPPAIVQSLAECGLSAAALSLNHDQLSESDVVTIASAKIDMFPCIRKASWAKFDVHFQDASLQKLYGEYDAQQQKAEARRHSLEWLAARNLRDGLPVFEANDSSIGFARKLERFCGIEPGVAINAVEPKSWTFRRSFMTFPINPKFECLVNAMMASDLESRGIELGFIGNAAVAEPAAKR